MKIAIIGSGIAGNRLAHTLHREHDITVYEAASYIGGHTHTHDIDWHGEQQRIDTGFIVFNDWTYPNFIALLDEIGVESQPSSMSFSVQNALTQLEYNGTTLNTLFAQRSNLLRPQFYRFIREILRFNREAPALLAADIPNKTDISDIPLGEYLSQNAYSRFFIDNYLIPMGAAIWSTDPVRMLAFPARFFVQFFHNHGMLSVDKRPEWRVIKGGSDSYVAKLTAPFKDRIRLNTPVERVSRSEASSVIVKAFNAEPEHYDYVFFACHSDQALRLLRDATAEETRVLGAIGYQRNEVVLHTDTTMLPTQKRAWAAWNYHVPAQAGRTVKLTYNMNILQSLRSKHTFCVTLNRSDEIAPQHIIKRLSYDHPIYTPQAIAAQARQADINIQRTFFCGAYWRNGFHEDGVWSAIQALAHFDTALKNT
jgi:uncharacterized protein